MAVRQPLTVKGFLIMADGNEKPIEELTDEERASWNEERTARIKRNMISYYRQHPEEFALLKDVEPNDYEKRA